jgi:gas vesicle protein
MSTHSYRPFLIGLIAGSLTGAAVALLFAPKSGEENRKLIKEQSQEARDKVVTFTSDAQQRAKVTAENSLEQVSELTERTRVRIDDQRQTLQEKLPKREALLQKLSFKKSELSELAQTETAEETA